ncbi:MAG: winged helix-turn-helix transcriptional regulator [Candidatus Odinarchaeota archaeon]|nr:winged helix-turn-helix transcriptional regulator [Candidatus Odinarchaeota archaeon]
MRESADGYKVIIKTESHKDQRNLPSEKTLEEMTSLFKVLANQLRLKILYSIRREKARVCEIARIVEMDISAVSHQLRILKLANLVKSKRVGREVYYRLANKQIIETIELIYTHVKNRRGKSRK